MCICICICICICVYIYIYIYICMRTLTLQCYTCLLIVASKQTGVPNMDQAQIQARNNVSNSIVSVRMRSRHLCIFVFLVVEFEFSCSHLASLLTSAGTQRTHQNHTQHGNLIQQTCGSELLLAIWQHRNM